MTVRIENGCEMGMETESTNSASGHLPLRNSGRWHSMKGSSEVDDKEMWQLEVFTLPIDTVSGMRVAGGMCCA